VWWWLAGKKAYIAPEYYLADQESVQVQGRVIRCQLGVRVQFAQGGQSSVGVSISIPQVTPSFLPLSAPPHRVSPATVHQQHPSEDSPLYSKIHGNIAL